MEIVSPTLIDYSPSAQPSFLLLYAVTTKAINELESGKGKRFDTPDDLFQDLGRR